MSELYVGFDLSYAKTGWAVIEVIDRIPQVLTAGLIKSNTDKESYERIDDTVTEIKYILSHTTPKTVIKEASIIGKYSSATPIIKTHAVYEHELARMYHLEDIANMTVKKWARRVTGAEGKRRDKMLIAEAVEKYFDKRFEVLWTKRGKLIDDTADAIALTIAYLEKNDLIDIKNF